MQYQPKKAYFSLSLLTIFVLSSFLLAACDNNTQSPTATTSATTTNSISSAPPTTAATTTSVTTQTTAQTTTALIATTTVQVAATNAVTTPNTTIATTSTIAVSNTTTAPTTSVAPPTPTLAPTTEAAPTTLAVDTSKPRYIAAMRAKIYSSAGPIQLGALYEQTSRYKANLISYESDGLKISGLMYVPSGRGPFPLALVNHGYFDPSDYGPGWDTLRELRYFAANGYVTIASDYRNYGSSSKGDNTIQPGYTDDILNLIEAAKKTSFIDKTKITIMGHSMGGEITLDILVVSKDIKVAALFGTMSADASDNYYARIRWGSKDTGQYASYYGTPDKNPDVYQKLSPLTYFKDISVPVEVNSGTNDTTTPPAWSEKVYNALKAAGKTTEFYTYLGEGHSLNGAAFDLAMSRTLAFFNKALGIR